MPENYTVQQGDHLSSIAKDNGFTDYTIIWNHPKNADLKNKRQNPNILLPGDEIFIPDMEEKQESGATDKKHTFKVDKTTLKLRLVLEDIYEKPIAGAQCALLIDGQVYQLTTDGNGKLEQEIPLDAKEGVLTIRGDQTPFANEVLPIKIGHLDPIDEVSGQVARLNNLGYFAGPVDGSDTDAFNSAVQEFQCDNSLTVDGDCGPQTQSKLKQVYGC
ncbi:MAG: peptidoglycan-binding protein [Candidatus Acidiferrum sp.]|jgi:N-acetylmuramoyl-L-alanine amidase